MPREPIELTDSNDPTEVAYPKYFAWMENEILAGRRFDDELIDSILELQGEVDQREYAKTDLPPIVQRYRNLLADGAPLSCLRVNGEKLRTYDSDTRDVQIREWLGATSRVEKERGYVPESGFFQHAVAVIARIQNISEASVLRHWTRVGRPEDKRSRGRPRKKKPD